MTGNIRRFGWVWVLAVNIGWGDQPLQTGGIRGRSACATDHIPAADPFGTGRNADLITRAAGGQGLRRSVLAG